jgi:hypothetical protein
MSAPANDVQAQLTALLTQMQGQAPNWTPAVAPQTTGVAVPVRLSTPIGEVRCYLHLPPTAAATPAALLAAMQALSAAGWEINAWQPRDQQQQGWSNGGGWQSRRRRW